MVESRCDAEHHLTKVRLVSADDALVQLLYNCYF